MDEMETDEPVEAQIAVKAEKRGVSEAEDGGECDKEHVVKKQKLSACEDDVVKNNDIAEKCNDEVVPGGRGTEGILGNTETFVKRDETGIVIHQDASVDDVASAVKLGATSNAKASANEDGDLASRKAQEVSVIVVNVASENKAGTPMDHSGAELNKADSIKEVVGGAANGETPLASDEEQKGSKQEEQIKVSSDLIVNSSGESLSATAVSVIKDGAEAMDESLDVNTLAKERILNCNNETQLSLSSDGDGLTRAAVSEERVKSGLSSDNILCNTASVIKGNPDVAAVNANSVSKFVNGEKEVGITEFVNPMGSMPGIIKQRYSDFVVNELNLAGHVVELTTREIPKEAACECPDVSHLLGEDIVQRLDGLQNDKNLEKVLIPVDSFTKDDRRKVHQFVRAKYSKLLSTTEDIENQKFVIVTHGSKDQSRQGKNRKQTSWPPDRGNYTQFVLHKENVDTMDAVNIISKYLKMNPGSFTYAGTKDKRAVTSQLVTVYRVVAEKLAGLNRILRNIALGNFEYVKSPLRLGDLSGNRFKIVLRKVENDSASVKACMTSLAARGFVNYFGMQRFGTTAIPTYHIGRALLRGDWKDAIELILKPRDGDDTNYAECRKLWWETRNASAALAKLQRKNSVEGQLLYGLESHGPNDLVNAINCVPRNTRMMYTHSYQSYVWNRVVSRRLQKYQFDVIEGDLFDTGPVAEGGSQPGEKVAPRVYKASEVETIPDITQIVLPLPGYDVLYPDNEIASWYREVMIADGLDIDNMRHKVQSYSLSGSYRKMLVKPVDVSWKIVKYDDVNVPLLNSDLDVLSGKQELTDSQDGSFTALKMEFSLPPSSYATMALREVMKVDTSVAFQSTLK